MRADHLDVQLRMINVSNLKRAVSVAWCFPLQLEIKRCMHVRGTMALPFKFLLKRWTRSHSRTEGHIARSGNTGFVTLALQSCPRCCLRFLLETFVVILDRLGQQATHLFGKAAGSVSPFLRLW